MLQAYCWVVVMKNRNIAIIGNSPAAQILVILLQEKGRQIYRISSVEDEKKYMPFYANDLDLGILGRVCEKTGLDIHSLEDKERKIRIGFQEGKSLDCHSSMEGFRDKLEKAYPDEHQGLAVLFADIEGIGEEWASFIKNDFHSKGVSMKKSAKYATTTVKDYLKRIKIGTSDISKILYAMLPIGDVTFPVFSGYISTQFFDNHHLKENPWKEIARRANRISEKISVEDIKKVSVALGESPSTEPAILAQADSVIDLRFFPIKGGMDGENMHKVIWGGRLHTDGLDEERIYYLTAGEDVSLRLWTDLYGTQSKKNHWNFEMLIREDQGQTEESISKLLKGFLAREYGAKVRVEELFSPGYFENAFDGQYGYGWAFNKKQVMSDPTNLYSPQSEALVRRGFWGFAWFSAALNIYHLLTTQTATEKKYIVKDVQRKENELDEIHV